MRRFAFVTLAVVAGLALGIGSAVWAARTPILGDMVRVGAWRADLSAGSRDAGLYSRARVALIGLLALDRSETIYFVADSDDEGRKLDGACRYVVEGRAPSARWWSLTVYGADYFLVENPERKFSVNARSALVDRNGRFRIKISAKPQPDPHIAVPSAGPFVLNLRLYNPSLELAQNPSSLIVPAIRREACR